MGKPSATSRWSAVLRRRTAALAALAALALAAAGCSVQSSAPDGAADDAGLADAAAPDDAGADAAAPGDADEPPDASDIPDGSTDPDAPPESATITHSTDATTIEPNHAVSCNAGAPTFFHTDNSYWRVFDLPGFGISSPFVVTSVGVGIDRAWSPDGAQPIEVRLYTLDGDFTTDHLTSLGSVAVTVDDQAQSVLEVPFDGAVAPAGAVLVLEVHTPSGVADGRGFFLGSNSLGESGPSYLSADECHLPQPTDIASIDSAFADIDWVLTVTGIYFP